MMPTDVMLNQLKDTGRNWVDERSLASVQSWVRAAAADIVARLPLPNKQGRPTVEVCFTDSMSLSPSTVLLSEPSAHYGILLSEPAFMMLKDVFWRMLSHRDTFPDVGDPTLEVASEPSVARLHHNVEQYLRGGRAPYVLPVPRCPIRASYGEALLHYAALGLVFHELGYVVQGHILLRRRRYLLRVEQRTLEHAADIYAGYKTGLVTFNPKQKELLATAGVTDEDRALDVARRALCALPLFWPDAFDDSGKYATAEQPDPRLRQLALLEGISAARKSMLGDPTSQGVRERTLVDCERAYMAITGSRDHLATVDARYQNNEGVTLFKHWQTNLRPLLLRLTYTDLPTAGATDDSVFTEPQVPLDAAHMMQAGDDAEPLVEPRQMNEGEALLVQLHGEIQKAIRALREQGLTPAEHAVCCSDLLDRAGAWMAERFGEPEMVRDMQQRAMPEELPCHVATAKREELAKLITDPGHAAALRTAPPTSLVWVIVVADGRTLLATAWDETESEAVLKRAKSGAPPMGPKNAVFQFFKDHMKPVRDPTVFDGSPTYSHGVMVMAEARSLVRLAEVLVCDANVFSGPNLALVLDAIPGNVIIPPAVRSELDVYLSRPPRTVNDEKVHSILRGAPTSVWVDSRRYQSLEPILCYYLTLLFQRRDLPHQLREMTASPKQRAEQARLLSRLSPGTSSMSTQKERPKGPADEEVVAYALFEALVFGRNVIAVSADGDVYDQFFKLRSLLESDHLAFLVANDIVAHPEKYPERVPISEVVDRPEIYCTDPSKSFAIELPLNPANLFAPIPEQPVAMVLRPGGEVAQFFVTRPTVSLATALQAKQAGRGKNTSQFGGLNCYVDLPYKSPRGRPYALFIDDRIEASDPKFDITAVDLVRVIANVERPVSLSPISADSGKSGLDVYT